MGDAETAGSSGGGGVTQAAANKASELYNKAPDLGVTSTAQAVYEKIPSRDETTNHASNMYTVAASSVGLGGTGQEQQQDAGRAGDDEERGDGKDEQESGPGEGSESQGGLGQGGDRHDIAQSLEQISKDKGPSDKSRLYKPQQQLGTEYGIPTMAGAGCTASPDMTNQNAIRKEKENGKAQKAAVPEDYAPNPCPDKNAGTGKVDDIQKQAAEQTAHGGSGGFGGGQGGAAGQSQPNGNSQQHADTTHDDEADGGSKKRDAIDKLKDKTKGNFTVLKGAITRNEEKVSHGKAIKHGEA